MKNTPVDYQTAQKVIEGYGLTDFGKATIREVVAISTQLEQETNTEFIHMEMGVPGLKAAQVGVDAEINALKNGIASIYPNINGIPEVKNEASRFIKAFIDMFWLEAGLKRSLDKIYEIIVYALFSTLVEALELKVEIAINNSNFDLLKEFEDFTQSVMCLDFSNPTATQDAKVYRVGVTNAADRGLDMYSNWGPAIQIKHLSLDVDLAENIVSSVSSDRIIIVCKSAEKEIIVSLLTQAPLLWKFSLKNQSGVWLYHTNV